MKHIIVERKENYLIATLNRPKVNALNAELVMEVRRLFEEVGEDDLMKGIILTGKEGLFSAGLDVVELYNYDHEEMANFMQSFAMMYRELAAFKKVFVCAINGHCPAGGTVMAIMADYRIMCEGEKYGIGLNEVSVNVQISNFLIEVYGYWLGRSEAYRNIMGGKLLSPKQALVAGLVNKLVIEDELLAEAEKQMRKYLSFNYDIVVNTKAKLRKQWFKNAPLDYDELDLTLKVWWSDEVRASMKMFVDMLQNKNKT